MIRRFEEALEFMREDQESNHPKDYLYRHVVETTTEEDLAVLADCIAARSALPSCESLRGSRTSGYFLTLCDRALPAMFSEAELGDYFLDMLIAMHEDEGTWKRRGKREIYEMITGSGHCHGEARQKPLPRIFHDVYESRFFFRHRVPGQFKDRAIELVRQRKPLVPIYQEYQEKYCSTSRDSFLSWLDNCIVEEVGEDEFARYVHDAAGAYVSGLPGNSYRHLTYSRLMLYAIGCSWTPVKISIDRGKAHSHCSKHGRLDRLLVSSLLPYACGATQDRTAVYDYLGLGKQEREAYDQKAAQADRCFVPAGLIAAGDSQLPKPMLPGDVSFEDLLEAFDAYFAKRYLAAGSPRGPIPSLGKMRNEFKDHAASSNAGLHSAYKRARREPVLKVALDEHLENKIAALRRHMFEGNAADVASGNMSVWLYIPVGDFYKGRKIDFSPLRGARGFEQAARAFLRSLYRQAIREGTPRAMSYIPDTMVHVIELLAFLLGECRIGRLGDIEELHVLAMLSHKSKEGLSASMVHHYLVGYRKFFRFLIGHGHIDVDPTANLSIKSGWGYSRATPEIPDDILVFLENHIDEIRSHSCRLMFRIAMETGWRISDIRNILVEDVEEDGSLAGMPQVKARSSKTAASRIKLRLGDKLFAVVSPDLHREILSYVEETAGAREMYEIDTLFFSIVNGEKTAFRPMTFNDAINRLLERHGIRSIDEGYDGFFSRQTRKTVAVELITSGATLAEVQKQLGHTSSAATERVYAQVRGKKLAELNSDFYRQKFGLLIESGRLDLYTEEERRLLYVDFCTNRRNVELGVCSKHPSEGRCADMGNISCACCPKLCTGKAYRGRWEELYGDSSRLLAEFEAKYDEMGIPRDEYEAYVEYKQEKTLNERYRAVLDAIEKGC